MRPRTKASLLWGLTDGLAFLVLLQAFRLATGESVTLAATVGVTLLVACGATLATYLLEGRVAGSGQKEQP